MFSLIATSMAVGLLCVPPPRPMASSYPPDYVTANWLLSQEVGTPIPPLSDVQIVAVGDALRTLCIAREICPQNNSYMFKYPISFERELNDVREWAQKLKDAPPASDAYRFAPEQYYEEHMRFNRKIMNWLSQRQEWESDRQQILNRAIKEVDECYYIYSTARTISAKSVQTQYKRMYMLQLVNLIGKEDYVAMNLGPSVPDWIFTDL